MRMLQVLRRYRLTVLLGSALLCLLGLVSGCDDGTTAAKLDPVANKAREEAESSARKSAYGNAGYQAKAIRTATPKK